jgi:hypothetical protein
VAAKPARFASVSRSASPAVGSPPRRRSAQNSAARRNALAPMSTRSNRAARSSRLRSSVVALRWISSRRIS